MFTFSRSYIEAESWSDRVSPNRPIQNQGKLIRLHEIFVKKLERNEELMAVFDEKNAELYHSKTENERLKGLACGHDLITFDRSPSHQSTDEQVANLPAIQNDLPAAKKSLTLFPTSLR